MKALGLFVLLVVVKVYGWGEEGHQGTKNNFSIELIWKVIAQIASELLTSTATNVADQFLGDHTLEQIAPWPDSYAHTSQGAWSKPCHYANLPKDATSFQMSYCTGCCVVSAIQNYTSILQSEVSNPFECDFTEGDEPCALEFLVHFVGDVHQPLHVGYGYDEGGNSVTVDWFGTQTELHAVWDDSIIQKWNDYESSAAKEIMDFINANPSLIKQYLSTMDPVAWANESFQIVRTNCYNYTLGPDGVPDLGSTYYEDNLPIVKDRLAAAGVRLAKLLNTVFSGQSSDWKKLVKLVRVI